MNSILSLLNFLVENHIIDVMLGLFILKFIWLHEYYLYKPHNDFIAKAAQDDFNHINSIKSKK